MFFPAGVFRGGLANPPPLKRRATTTQHRMSACCSPGLQTRCHSQAFESCSPLYGAQLGSFGALALVAAFNAGNFLFCWIFSALQRCKPPAARYAQRLEFQPSVSVWKSLDLCEPSLK